MAVFRYIPSAFQSASGFLTTHDHKRNAQGNLIPDLSTDIFVKIRDKVIDKGFDMGVLSNAYTEVSDLKGYDEILSKKGITTYSDSGGLQVLTRGLDITDDLKNKIYTNQCLYSDLAMCFDELPVRTIGERGDSASSMIDNSGRYYIDTLFQLDGTATGKNIVKQIQTFKKLYASNPDAKGKVLIILQGKDFETLREFAWFLFQEVKKEENWEDYVSGLAIGNTTAFGNAGLTDTILRFQYELEFIPDTVSNNIHILGAGTINKIFSFFMVPDTYWKTDDFVLSADSTTQTKAMQFGKYISFDKELMKKVDTQTGRNLTQTTESICNEIYNYHKDVLDKHSTEAINEDTFREHYTQYNDNLYRLRADFGDKDCLEAQYQYYKRSIFSKYFWTMKMIDDYFQHLIEIKSAVKGYRTGCKENYKKLEKLLTPGSPTWKATRELLKVNTHADYMGNTPILSGHPYKVKLPMDLITDENNVVTYKGTKYITDVYNKQRLGRELVKGKVQGKRYSGQGVRHFISVYLSPCKLETVPTEDYKEQTLDDEW